MFKALRYLLGTCVGASIMGALVAHCMLFLATGKVPVMLKGQARLLDVEQATACLRNLVEKGVES